MAPLQLSMISDRFEIMLGAVQSTMTLGSRHGHGVASKVQVRWRSHRPAIQDAQPSQNKRGIANLDFYSLSSIEGTDGSETLVSEGASKSYYALPSVPITLALPPQPGHVFTGSTKILPNIADFDCDAEGTSDADTDTFYSYEGTQPKSPVDLETSATTAVWHRHPTSKVATPCRELIECVTALSPPPLHHSGRTRSKVVFIPRNSPGTCPIHGCGDCGLCDPSKPFLFTI